MRPKLKLYEKYKMMSGFDVVIKYKNTKDGKTTFIGKSLITNNVYPDENFYEFDETGMPFGASNSQILVKGI